MNSADRGVWGTLLLALLFAGAAGLAVPLLLFPETQACYGGTAPLGSTILERCEWPNGGLVKALLQLLALPVFGLLLVGLDRLTGARSDEQDAR